MHVGVGESALEVVEVEVGEDEVGRAPQQQDRHVGEIVETGRDRVEGVRARVLGFERDVGDELADRLPTCRGPVRSQEARPDRGAADARPRSRRHRG